MKNLLCFVNNIVYMELLFKIANYNENVQKCQSMTNHLPVTLVRPNALTKNHQRLLRRCVSYEGGFCLCHFRFKLTTSCKWRRHLYMLITIKPFFGRQGTYENSAQLI